MSEDRRDVLLAAELPDIRHAAEVILEGPEFATAAGWPYDRWSEPVVKALAQRLLTMVDALERLGLRAPPPRKARRKAPAPTCQPAPGK